MCMNEGSSKPRSQSPVYGVKARGNPYPGPTSFECQSVDSDIDLNAVFCAVGLWNSCIKFNELVNAVNAANLWTFFHSGSFQRSR